MAISGHVHEHGALPHGRLVLAVLGVLCALVPLGLVASGAPRAPETLEDATTYAVPLGVIGLLNVAGGAYGLARTVPAGSGSQ